MATIVICTHNVLGASEWGGHMWVYLQYIESLRRLGCEVYWMEDLDSEKDKKKDVSAVTNLARKLDVFGISDKLIIFRQIAHRSSGPSEIEFLSTTQKQGARIFAKADLLLNFCYGLNHEILSRFRRTALVDIDPALLQFWMSTGQLVVQPHDLYFTTGETIGVSRLVCDTREGEGEFAIIVQEDTKGKGVASHLMHRVIDWARGRGLGAVVGLVLADNAPMLGFMRHLGFSLHRMPDEPDVVEARLALE